MSKKEDMEAKNREIHHWKDKAILLAGHALRLLGKTDNIGSEASVDEALTELINTSEIRNSKESTGLCDAKGREIFFGDRLRKPVDCNEEFHGSWAIYEVRRQGATPLLAYLRSEMGRLLPEGYLAAPLADEYDRKMFCFARDPKKLRPMDDIEVIGETEWKEIESE